MLNDNRLTKAVSNIAERAERVYEPSVLLATFVDTGAIAQIDNNSNQIIYGRRGSGKTHVLRVLNESTPDDILSIYLDCRTLGSSGNASADTDPRIRASAIFRDIARLLWDRLFDKASDVTDKDQEARALNLLDLLDSHLFGSLVASSEVQVTESRGNTVSGGGGIEARVAAVPSITARTGRVRGGEEQSTVSYTTWEVTRLNFAEINRLLGEIISCLGLREIRILIDEWAEIPTADQPLVAEYLKKAFFANPRVAVKIAALEYRSNFNTEIDGQRVGFEIGGDVFVSADLDDYFLPDRNPAEVHRAYAQLLHRHLSSNFDGDLSELDLTEANIPSRLFTQTTVFDELVRASEGVPRDFNNIFVQAAFAAKRRGRDTIDMAAVTTASRKWYEQDKRRNLNASQEQLLHKIINEVIGERRARCFMLSQAHADHPVIRALYDLRVIHRIKAGYSGRDQPGIRYDIYALDYGTYVEFRNTSAALENDFSEGEVSNESVVPFDDNRSIRRVILSEAILDAGSAA